VTAVAILLPGIMGSVLKLGDETIWPGPLTSLWLPFRKMKELLRDDLVATDCIRTFSITNQYQSLIDDLATCGFSEGDGTLAIGAYDWRKDNAESARKLAEHIDTAVTRHGADVEISLVAHSMGGLVARYYLESGQFKDQPGFGRVRRLLTLGTPHNGAALALRLVLGHEKRLFLSKEQVLQATSDPRYPAAYQLLPPAGEPFAWNGAADQQFEPLDIYDVAVAEPLGLVAANIDAAKRFRSGLDLVRRPSHVRYFCFAGSSQTTATHVLLRPAGGGKLRPDAIEEEDGGDGTVPTWSGFASSLQRQFVRGEHGTIYQSNGLRTALATLLGKPGLLAGVPAHVEVAVRDPVVEPGDMVHVMVGFSQVVQDFSGVLTIERAQTDPTTGMAVAFDPPQQLYPVAYKGLGMETMALLFQAPDLPGAYRVAFRDEAGALPSGYDGLIVQQP
jgi:pimeloyl-ACP methyl ester carboxylesterase